MFSFLPYRLTNLQIKIFTVLLFIRAFTEKNLADQDRKVMQKIYAINGIFAKVITILTDIRYSLMIPESKFTG